MILSDYDRMQRAIGGRTTTVTATIASGTSASANVDLDGRTLVGLYTPAAWTAAAISFLAVNGATAAPIKAPDGEVTIPVGEIATSASNYFALDPGVFAGVDTLRVVSGTAGAAVNQAADRTLTLVTRSL